MPRRAPGNLADAVGHQVGVVGCDRAIQQADHDFGSATGAFRHRRQPN
jgi:hypothetical protein